MVVCDLTKQQVRHVLTTGHSMNDVVIHQIVSCRNVVVCLLVMSVSLPLSVPLSLSRVSQSLSLSLPLSWWEGDRH